MQVVTKKVERDAPDVAVMKSRLELLESRVSCIEALYDLAGKERNFERLRNDHYYEALKLLAARTAGQCTLATLHEIATNAIKGDR